MNLKEAKILLEKIDSILRNMEGHQISDDYEFFGEITYHDLVVLAKQLIIDFNISEDDYYFPCLKEWYEN